MWLLLQLFILWLVGFLMGYFLKNRLAKKPEQTKTKPIMNFKEWENKNVTWED